jgi:predicted nucleotidyltransferase
MVVKKKLKKKQVKKLSPKKKIKKSAIKKVKKKQVKKPKIDFTKLPSLKLRTESEIAMDFATKAYKKFDKIVKSIILFGSSAKKKAIAGSDIDIIILLDDVSIKWDQQLIAWYRTELEKIVKSNPYKIDLHINTIKLSTWWEDLMRGDPVVINIIRDGKSLLDFGGFFDPLKYLLLQGKIKSTPEAIYSLLQRAPAHITRSRVSELNTIEGLFWSMVDSGQAALIAANVVPSSPENLALDLKETFVDAGKLKMKYVEQYRDLLLLHKKIMHGHITDIKGIDIDKWQDKAEDFLKIMVDLVKELIE